jgi:isopenicillin-N epimerase
VATGAHDFPLQAGVTLVNHASYGIATRRSLAIANEIRERFEGDSLRQFAELAAVHRAAARAGAHFTGLTDGEFALTANATAGASAVTSSLALTAGNTVVVLGCEYPSVIRAWEVATARAGAALHVLRVPLPLSSSDDLVERLDAEVSGGVDVLQVSLVASGWALVLDLAALSRWVGGRGGRLIVDAAHGPGTLTAPRSPSMPRSRSGPCTSGCPCRAASVFCGPLPRPRRRCGPRRSRSATTSRPWSIASAGRGHSIRPLG